MQITAEANNIRAALLAKLWNLAPRKDGLEVEHISEAMEQATAAQMRELAADEADRRRASAQRIHAALKRLDAGTYGVCVGCDEEISPKRLAALPEAMLCLACQAMSDTLSDERRRTVRFDEVA